MLFRCIQTEPASGVMNMAIDEALLESAAEDPLGPATLRIYRWAKPTLSLGYFQAAKDREQHSASRNCELIRRPSGGGAILHDDELTYSLALPEQIARQYEAHIWYTKAHQALTTAVQELTGDQPSLCANPAKLPASDEPYLCFQRRAEGDVLLDEHKIAGSAQRRRRGTILQHGSVLLSRSSSAPELPGINDLAASTLTFDELCVRFSRLLIVNLGAEATTGQVTAAENAAATRLAREKYGSEGWTHRR